MKVLSLFDGISCGRVALERAGIPVERYVAFEVDKYAIQVSRNHYPDIEQVGDITYDKMQSVVERHRDAVNETKYAKAIHALAPATNTAKTPVLLTTGAKSTDGTRRMIALVDIIAQKAVFDKLKVPTAGRVLVLCNEHVQDLLSSDQKFANQYYNYTTGKICNLYGFEVYEFSDNPYFKASTKTKLAWGAVPDSGDFKASVAYYAPRMFKATGRTISYPTPAEATMQEHLYNVRHYFIALPKKQEAIGAIVSAPVVVE